MVYAPSRECAVAVVRAARTAARAVLPASRLPRCPARRGSEQLRELALEAHPDDERDVVRRVDLIGYGCGEEGHAGGVVHGDLRRMEQVVDAHTAGGRDRGGRRARRLCREDEGVDGLVTQLEHRARDVTDLPDVGGVEVPCEHDRHVERVVLRCEGRQLLEERRRLRVGWGEGWGGKGACKVIGARLLGAHLGLREILGVAREMRRDEENALARVHVAQQHEECAAVLARLARLGVVSVDEVEMVLRL
eukprot:scaffold32350_cov60-Phaeocystis_antarctica.AAC.3